MLPEQFQGRLSLPLIGAPMFIVSGPELVIAQCRSGIIGAFPALNARPQELLDDWLGQINETLGSEPDAAPFAVNQICHPSNKRLEQDVELCVKHRVPIVITSLSPPAEIVQAVHSYGGLVFHDVISMRHARKAAAQGVDGLILVAAGAGGHAGQMSPFALVNEARQWFDGCLILAGAMSTGSDILAAQVMGADLAYMGTRFIATKEARASADYKQMLIDSCAGDIVYSSLFTGVKGNYLRGSIAAAGLDPDHLPEGDIARMDFEEMTQGSKAWKDIWGAGQGVGSISDLVSAADVVGELAHQYTSTKTLFKK
ncbi:MAG: NAD(P)H-dependent flavin oxidoreductase [Porticoccaceae bacterium]